MGRSYKNNNTNNKNKKENAGKFKYKKRLVHEEYSKQEYLEECDYKLHGFRTK